MPKIRLEYGDVAVTAMPDLCVKHRGEEFLLKLDFGKKKPDRQVASILLYILYKAATQAGLSVDYRHVLYFDMAAETEYKCPKESSQLKTILETSCKEYADMWSTLT
jgi:hypothetical protein